MAISKLAKKKNRILKSFRLPQKTLNEIIDRAKNSNCSEADAIAQAFDLLNSRVRFAPLSLENAIEQYKITEIELANFVRAEFISVHIYSEGRRADGYIHPSILATGIVMNKDMIQPEMIATAKEESNTESKETFQLKLINPNDDDSDVVIRYKKDAPLAWRQLKLTSNQVQRLVSFLDKSDLNEFYTESEFRYLRLNFEIISLNSSQSLLIQHLYNETISKRGAKWKTFITFLKENKINTEKYKKQTSFKHLFSKEKYIAFEAATTTKDGKYFLKL